VGEATSPFLGYPVQAKDSLPRPPPKLFFPRSYGAHITTGAASARDDSD